ncbi:15-hydroxyprostaglandin dehydrogenase [NAD(+)]-like [Cylas formicarius]|uniref:15-hydroxyprostaglandin dehydrogenase [NAD(+)]-like n=1 Tax=Cylas formicarius TaxID=197179 RepID=UPI002958489B|nr:15-hydroxyprostaglandin dehydrogenase [NAD(+)]-like [Cylas formicarius]
MVFEVKDKVALITGGASGIGLRYAKELLKQGAKGVVLADIDPDFGATALAEIDNEFGKNKAIFVKTDVIDIQQFENAFKKTVETFKNVDILINNAGILNEKAWEKEILLNVNGVVNGVLLGLENYLQKYRSGSEAVIVNASSIAGVEAYGAIPIYCATKFAVNGMTLSWGHPFHYERTKVKVVAICPGVTEVRSISDVAIRNLGPAYEEIRRIEVPKCKSQKPEHVAEATIEVLRKAESGTVWIIEAGEAPYKFVFPDRFKLSEKIFLK